MLVLGLGPVLWGLSNRPADATLDENPGVVGSRLAGPNEITTFAGTLRSGSIWGLGLCMFLVAIAISGFGYNLQPIMLNSGLSVEGATTISSLFYLAVMIGRLVGGIMLDTMSRYHTAFIVFAISAAGAIVLANESHISFAVALLGTTLIAISQGAEADFLGYFVQKEFGSRSFAITFGTILPMFSAGTIVGPYLFAFLRDWTGNYRIALSIGSAFYMLGIVALLLRMVARNRRGAPT
jgi:MFS family permease